MSLGLLIIILIHPAHAQFTNTTSNGKVTITGYSPTTVTTLTIPNTLNGLPVTAIAASAFLNFGSLTSVTIPDSVTAIGASAFGNCSHLTSATFYGNAPTAGSGIFVSAAGALRVYYNAFSTGFTSPTWTTSSGDTYPSAIGPFSIASYDSGMSYTITGYTGSGGPVIIPPSILGHAVSHIGANAFYDNINVTSVTMPASVTTIQNDAFYNCPNLTSATIPASVTTIEDEAFYNCIKLASAPLSTGLTTIGTRSFANTLLTALTLPSTITTLGDGAFLNCPLGTLTIPTSVTSIGFQTFEGTGLTTVNIPDSVTSIGGYAFGGPTLTSITVDSANPDFSSVGGVLFNKDQTTLFEYPNGLTATSYTIPAGVTSVGASAFTGSTNLVTVTVPSSVNTIGLAAFASCYALANITIPPGVADIPESAFTSTALTGIAIPSTVTSIENSAFDGCLGLTSVTIPASVTYIGPQAFGGCSNLTSALFLGNAPTMDGLVFVGTATNFQVNYLASATGFATPDWTDSAGDVYPAYPTGSGFSDWLTSHHLTGGASDTPLNDGVPNLLKYLYDIDPSMRLTSTDRAALPTLGTTISGSTNYLTLTYRQNPQAAGLSVSVQVSTDLQTWTTLTQSQAAPTDSATYSLTQTGTSNGDPIMQVKVLGNVAPAQFIRLNVTPP